MKIDAETIKTINAEQHALKPVQQEYKLVGHIRQTKGLHLWSINTSGVIEKISIQYEAMLDLEGKPVLIAKAEVDTTKRYCQALNADNARRKFNKQR